MRRSRLEEIFDQCSWDRKFTHHVPEHPRFVWRERQAEQAEKKLSRLCEETKTHVRALYLASDSLGQFLAVTEDAWRD